MHYQLALAPELKAKEAVPILCQRLVNIEESYEKGEIAGALGNIGDPSAIPYLQDVLKLEWNRPDILFEGVNIAKISQGLCNLGDKTGIDWLIRFLEFLGSQKLDNSSVTFLRNNTQFAISILAQYTDQDFGNIDKPEEHLKEIADRYRDWWDVNKDNLGWSTEYGLFILPSGWRSHRDKARSIYDEGDVAQAIAEYEEAIGKAPKTRASQLHFELGEVYSKQGMTNEANAEYYESQAQTRAMIEQGLMDPMLYNNLAWFYVEKKIKPEEALSLVKKALEQKPGSGTFMDTLVLCKVNSFN